MNWSSSGSTNPNSPGTGLLAAFIAKARTSGITTVGAARQSGADSMEEVINFNIARTGATDMIDAFTIEHEWWNGEISFAGFKSNLINLYNSGHTAAHRLMIDLYIGWPDPGEMIQLIPYIDRLLIHDYRSNPDYNYTRNRLIDIANGCASLGKILPTMPIFSSESNFMGPYYSSHTLYDAYYAYAVPMTATTRGSYNYETNTNIRDYISITGSMMFNYTLVRDAGVLLPPATGCTSFIYALGPTTFLSGSSVILTASTGTTYLWSPSGQTGDTITVTGSSNYYCSVTNSSGCTAVSNSIYVSVLPSGFTSYIVASGPLFFQLPSYVVLSAETIPVLTGSTTYQWFTLALTSSATTSSITAQTSGDYYCIVTNSSGQTAQTSSINVNAQYVPFASSNYTEGIFNSSLSYSASDTTFLWTPIALHLTDTTMDEYYIFIKMKSRSGAPTGLRLGINENSNFVPLTNVTSTTYRWYRIGALNGQLKKIITDPIVNYLYFKALNNNFDMEKIVVSTNPNYVPGPYPTSSP
jgi:hypothetical protein